MCRSGRSWPVENLRFFRRWPLLFSGTRKSANRYIRRLQCVLTRNLWTFPFHSQVLLALLRTCRLLEFVHCRGAGVTRPVSPLPEQFAVSGWKCHLKLHRSCLWTFSDCTVWGHHQNQAQVDHLTNYNILSPPHAKNMPHSTLLSIQYNAEKPQ